MINIIVHPLVEDDITYELYKNAFNKLGRPVLELEHVSECREDDLIYLVDYHLTKNTIVLLKDAIFYLDSRRSMSRQNIHNCLVIGQWNNLEATIIIFTSREMNIDGRIRGLAEGYSSNLKVVN